MPGLDSDGTGGLGAAGADGSGSISGGGGSTSGAGGSGTGGGNTSGASGTGGTGATGGATNTGTAGSSSSTGGGDSTSSANSTGGSGGTSGSGGSGGTTGTGGTTTGSGGASTTSSGGAGTTSSGGASTTGSSSTSTTGSGGAASVGADYVVDTSADENDAGATAANPLGTGLSLREAIILANKTAGAEVIYVDVPTVSLTSELTYLTDDASLYGGGTTLTISPAGSGACFRFEPGSYLIEGFTLRDCSFGVYNNGATLIARNNQIFDTTRYGYYSGGSDCQIIGNLLVRTEGIVAPPTAARNTFWFNTIVDTIGGNSGYGFNPGQSSENDFRNNIVTGSDAGGVSGTCNKYSYLSNNLFFGNASADSACLPLVDSFQQDPLYAAPGSDDYTLSPGSPAINGGIDVGLPYNGAAPDIGYWESP